MILEIVETTANLIISTVAIIVSICAIKSQTKQQRLQNTVQLFDKRIQIYNYLEDIFGLSGAIRRHLHLPLQAQKVSFDTFVNAMNKYRADQWLLNEIVKMTDKASIISSQATGLFEDDLSKYIKQTIDCFIDFVDMFVDFNCLDKTLSQTDYKKFKNLYFHINDRRKGEVVEKIDSYLDLRDIKRK